MLKLKNQKEKSFTLIELLVVIAVIAILAAVVLISLNDARQRSLEARGLQFSQNIKSTLATDLVGEWTFDSADYIDATHIRDTSGNGNNGTIYGEATIEPKGRVREALRFDGIDDYVDCGNGPSLNNINDEITIESWVIADDVVSTEADNAILLKGSYTYGITRDERSGANNRIWTYLNNGTNNLSATISLKVWQHIVFTYNKNLSNNQWKIYINGEVKNQRNFSQTITPSGTIFIGRCSTQYFKGTIDEVRVYKRALTAYEIKALYAEGKMRHLAGR